jgi:hypothetical protein
MADSVDSIFQRILRLVAEAGLPGVEEGTSYGNPALKVGGKSFATVKNHETIVISIGLDEKEALLSRWRLISISRRRIMSAGRICRCAST